MVPQSLQEEVLPGCHDCLTSGHLGQKNTYDQVRRGFMWHEMSLDVQLYIKTCATCSKNKKPWVKPKRELGSHHAGKLMERVHLDMMGPFPIDPLQIDRWNDITGCCFNCLGVTSAHGKAHGMKIYSF